jgi:hypothetical protein
MEKLIILTPAIARPEIHNIVFDKLINIFLKNFNIPIIWIINIDQNKNKTMYNQNIIKTNVTQEYTKMNILRYINNYNFITPIFNLSKSSGFWNATKFLMKKSLDYLNNNTGILWFEDDWILLKDINLKKIIDKYYTRNCYISLQFNELTFPPFIMGNYFYKKFVNIIDEVKVDPRYPKNDFIDPENVFRYSMYNILHKNKIHIHNFLINYDCKCLNKLLSNEKKMLYSFGLNKSKKVKAFLNKNNKSFLITTKKCSNDILKKINDFNKKVPFKSTTNSNYKTNVFLKINVIDYSKYKSMECSDNNIRIIKFYGYHLYKKNHGTFLDSGRIWKKIVSKLNKISNMELKIKLFLEYCNNTIKYLNKNGLKLNSLIYNYEMGGGISTYKLESTKLTKPESCNQDVWEKIIKLYDKLDLNGDNSLENKELIEISNLHITNINNRYNELLNNIPYVEKLEIDKVNKDANEKIEKIKRASEEKIKKIKYDKSNIEKLTIEERIIKMKNAIQGTKSNVEFWDFYEYMKTRTHDIPNIDY